MLLYLPAEGVVLFPSFVSKPNIIFDETSEKT